MNLSLENSLLRSMRIQSSQDTAGWNGDLEKRKALWRWKILGHQNIKTDDDKACKRSHRCHACFAPQFLYAWIVDRLIASPEDEMPLHSGQAVILIVRHKPFALVAQLIPDCRVVLFHMVCQSRFMDKAEGNACQ